ncbi:MAG: hypothetical protein HGA27_05780 [Peptococcaceae bacterium]|nr:hypothetical protein [Peptococcaceae bacterium]
MARFNWHKIGLGIFSVFLALLLWVYASGEQRYISTGNSQIISIDLQQKGVPEDMAVSSNLPANISVKVVGSGTNMENLNINNFEAFLDLSNLNEGEHNLPVIVNAPVGFEVSKVTPEKVYLVLEKIKEKQVAISVVFEGKPAKGYIPLEPVVVPEKVIIKGPASIVDIIDKIEAKVNIEAADGIVEQDIKVETDHKSVSVLPASVRVAVSVEPVPFKELEVSPRVVGIPAAGYEITGVFVTPSNIKIYDTSQKLQGYNILETEKIDITGASRDVKIRVNLLSPPNIINISASMVEVTVFIKKAAAGDVGQGLP